MLPSIPPEPLWPLAQELPPVGAANLWWAPPGFGKRSRLRHLLGDRPTTCLGMEAGPEALAAGLGVPLDDRLLWAWLAAQGDRPAALVLGWDAWAGHALAESWFSDWPLQGHPHALFLLAEGPQLRPEQAQTWLKGWVHVGLDALAFSAEDMPKMAEALALSSLEAQRLWRITGGWPTGLALAAQGQGEKVMPAWSEHVMSRWSPSAQAFALAAASWSPFPQAEAQAWGGGPWPLQLMRGGAWCLDEAVASWAWRPVARSAALAERVKGPWWRALPWASHGPVMASLFGAKEEAEAWRLAQDLGWRQAWSAIRRLESEWDEGTWQAWPTAQLLAAHVALEAGQEALALRHLASLPTQLDAPGLQATHELLQAQLAVGQGDWAKAERALAALGAHLQAADAKNEPLRWALLQLRVHWALGQGNLEAALELAEGALIEPLPSSPAARRTRLELMALVGSQRAMWGPLGLAESRLKGLLSELELQGALSQGLGLQDLAASALAACLAMQGRSEEARKALAWVPHEGEGGQQALMHRARALGLLGDSLAEALWQMAMQARDGHPAWVWPAWEWQALRPEGAPAHLMAKALKLAQQGGPLLQAWAAREGVAEAWASGRKEEALARWDSLPEGADGSLLEAYRRALGHRIGRMDAPPAGLEGHAMARLRPWREGKAPAPSAQAQGPKLQLFGPPQLLVNDAPVTKWPRRQARMLLLALALHPQGVHRSQLLAWLWPHMEEAGAAAQLHNASASLRGILEPQLPPRAPSQHLLWLGQRMCLKGLSCDVDQAEAQWAQWQSAQGGQGPQARELARKLLECPPLGGDEPWPEAWQSLRHRWRQRQMLLADWAIALPEPELELRAALDAFRAR